MIDLLIGCATLPAPTVAQLRHTPNSLIICIFVCNARRSTPGYEHRSHILLSASPNFDRSGTAALLLFLLLLALQRDTSLYFCNGLMERNLFSHVAPGPRGKVAFLLSITASQARISKIAGTADLKREDFAALYMAHWESKTQMRSSTDITYDFKRTKAKVLNWISRQPIEFEQTLSEVACESDFKGLTGDNKKAVSHAMDGRWPLDVVSVGPLTRVRRGLRGFKRHSCNDGEISDLSYNAAKTVVTELSNALDSSLELVPSSALKELCLALAADACIHAMLDADDQKDLDKLLIASNWELFDGETLQRHKDWNGSTMGEVWTRLVSDVASHRGDTRKCEEICETLVTLAQTMLSMGQSIGKMHEEAIYKAQQIRYHEEGGEITLPFINKAIAWGWVVFAFALSFYVAGGNVARRGTLFERLGDGVQVLTVLLITVFGIVKLLSEDDNAIRNALLGKKILRKSRDVMKYLKCNEIEYMAVLSQVGTPMPWLNKVGSCFCPQGATGSLRVHCAPKVAQLTKLGYLFFDGVAYHVNADNLFFVTRGKGGYHLSEDVDGPHGGVEAFDLEEKVSGKLCCWHDSSEFMLESIWISK